MLSFLLVSCPHQHVETQAQGDTGGKLMLEVPAFTPLGTYGHQKPVPSRVTGTVLQKLAEGPLACQSNTLWTTEKL